MNTVTLYQRTTEPTMNPFTSTILNYDRVQDRRRSLEQAAATRRLLRFIIRTDDTTHHASGPPGAVPTAAALSLVDLTDSGGRHRLDTPADEPTPVRVA